MTFFKGALIVAFFFQKKKTLKTPAAFINDHRALRATRTLLKPVGYFRTQKHVFLGFFQNS